MDEPRFDHLPVLYDAVVAALDVQPGALYADGTLGGGGHAEAVLDRGGHLVATDRDPAALAAAGARLARFGDRVELHHATFDQLPRVLAGRRPSGILLDLGVSSPQLDRPERGFSFRADGPVDFRMDPTSGEPLSALLDHLDEATLADALWRYGEERHARRVARAILAARPLQGTLHLASVVASATRGEHRIHPATRTFQGLRLLVNDELGQLERALRDLPDCLAPGGRLLVISFHSLEDRAVKHAFRQLAGVGAPTDPYGRPLVPPRFRLVHPGGVTATPDDPNPRARSARLRVLEALT